MNNLSFNKNNFIKSEPARFSKPIINNPNKLGRRTIEEIKEDMHLLNKPKIVEKESKKTEIIKPNNFNTFKNWNNK